MSTAALTSEKEKANLARIRDNQRRSRARRKEYLQELETKLRQCELHGIEASAEIQVAARRVANENKKLRALLIQNGIADESIEGFLSSTVSDAMIPSQYSGKTSQSVQILEQQLQTRACCTTTNGPGREGMSGSGSRDSSVSPSTVHPSPWSHPQNLDGPYSGVFRPSSERSTANGANMRYSPNPGPYHRLPSVPGNMNAVQNPNGPKTNQMPDYTLHSQLQIPVQYSPATHQNYLQPLAGPQTNSHYTYEPPSSSRGSVSSCVFAADLLTSMAGDDAANVRSDLGCPPDIDCEVDNQVVFNTMDRYTNPGIGL